MTNRSATRSTSESGLSTPDWIHPMRENFGRRLRVLYVDYSIGFGGSTKSLSLMLGGLRDVETMVVTAQDRDLIDTWMRGHRVWTFRRVVNYRMMWRVRSWTESRLPASLRWASLKALAATDLWAMLMGALRLAWLVRRRRVDLIHLNNGFTPPEALLAARLTDIPCVVHLRGFPDADRKPTERAKRWIEPVAHVIAVSEAVAADLEKKDLVASDRIVAIHNPVDLKATARAMVERDRIRRKYGLEPRHVAIGIFGRVMEWKGQAIFVEAAIRAMRRNPDIRAFIVGDESDGARDYVERISEMIRESGMQDSFRLTGYTPDVEAYFAAMDMVVHASIAPEPFGRVLPEAMAARRVIIAADAGGPREVISHGHDGLLVPPGDVDALAEAMLRLADDPVERARLAENGYRTAVSRFGTDAYADAVRAVYDAVLGGVAHRPEAHPVPKAIAELK